MPNVDFMQNRLRHSTTLWVIIALFFLLSACNSPANDEPQDASAAGGPTQTTIATAAATKSPVTLPTDTEPAGSGDTSPTTIPYPAPTDDSLDLMTPSPASYPAPEAITPIPTTTGAVTISENVYFPITGAASEPNEQIDPIKATPTPQPALDFAALRTELQANGQDLGFAKIGFHTTILDDRDLLDNWMQSLDQAGVPFFLKTVDNAEPLFRAQELMKASGVPHTLVFRSSGSVPHYELPAVQAAQVHWAEHRDQFPPELDPSLVWIETLNEPDRTKAEWFGQFAQEVARLAMADGFRWAAFSWASGEPEPEQWQTPSMLAFLRLAGENPDHLAIALHEYSYLEDDIAHEYPYKVGRFQELLRIADAHGFSRPTVLITEWGWQYNDIPPKDQALREIAWAANLYAPYPEVKGAAIWNLGSGCCYGDISEQVQQIIDPITKFSLNNYFAIPQPPAQQPINPEQFRP